MSQDNSQPAKAVILKTVVDTNAGIEYRLTSKGACSIYKTESQRYVDTLKPSTLKALAVSHPFLAELISDNAIMDSIAKQWELNKAKTYATKKYIQAVERAEQMMQAAADYKKVAGIK